MNKDPTQTGPREPRRGTWPWLADAALGHAAAMAVIARHGKDSRTASTRLLERFRRIGAHLRGLGDALPPAGGAHHLVLAETPAWRLCLLRLGPHARIPLHDHPDAYALALGLRGTVEVRTHARLPGALVGTVRLLQASAHTLRAADASLLDPWEVNLHALQAGPEGAELLTGHFAVGPRLRERNLYLASRPDVGGLVTAVVADARRCSAAASAHRSGAASATRIATAPRHAPRSPGPTDLDASVLSET